MADVMLRFDMRQAGIAKVSQADLYQAAIASRTHRMRIFISALIAPFLKQAWSGDTFNFEERTVTITPSPYSQPRPMILMGGTSLTNPTLGQCQPPIQSLSPRGAH